MGAAVGAAMGVAGAAVGGALEGVVNRKGAGIGHVVKGVW